MKRCGLDKRVVVIGMCSAGLLIAAPMASGSARNDDVLHGTTSQGKPVHVWLDKRHRLTSLTLTVGAKCTDHRKRSFSVTFSAGEINQDSAGNATGVLNEFAGSFFPGGGRSYSEHASFSARVTAHDVAGTARATRTFESGPACRTGTIDFVVKL